MKQTYEFKLASMPNQATRELMQPWLRTIEKKANGKIKFTYCGDEWVKKGSDLLDLVLDGTFDLNSFYASYHTDLLPLTTGIFGLPFLYPSGEAAAMIGWKMLQKYALKTEYKGLKLLWVLAPGVFQMHFASRPVHVLKDLSHMKFNIHGTLPAQTFKALGGCPVETEGDEMIQFLKRKLLDGIVVGWYTPMKYEEVTKYSTTNISCWTTGFPIVMNMNTWNNLPGEIQSLFEDNSGLHQSQHASAGADELNAQRYEKFKSEGREIYKLPDNERDSWTKAVQPVIEGWVSDIEAKSLPGKAIVQEIRSMIKDYSE